MPDAYWDAVVIGGGAAGLLAAARAALRGKRTLLLEKNARPGVKILMSGGTRCNITQNTNNRGIIEAFGKNGQFLHAALAALGVRELIALFEAEGVATKVEDTNKVFPVSDRASDVLAALVRLAQRSGVTLALGEPVQRVTANAGGFHITTPARVVSTAKVILTTGGQSYPGSGTTGDGYRIAAAFGHTIIPPRPALVPITTSAAWVRELRGITLPDVAVRVLDQDKPLATRRGSLLFAHFGLSGPVILDVSRAVSSHAQPQSLQLDIDFLPTMKGPALDDWLKNESLASGKKQLAVVLASLLPRRLCDELLRVAGQAVDRKAAALSKPDRARLVQAIQRARLPITGTLGFGKAEVTAGGVALTEVDSKTMQSKRQPGLYFAGEVLDLDGLIGGYNFQAAFSTGWLAGSSI